MERNMKNFSAGLASIIKNSTASVKKNSGVSIGFHDPDTWISTGNFALNYRISGSFDKGIPLGKVTMFAGESGSGKSFIVSGNIIREAQKQGIFVVLIDSENALDSDWLHALGVDTSEDKLLKMNMGMIGDVAKFTYEFIEGYRKDYEDVPRDERPKVLFVIDSIGMLNTEIANDQMKAGNLKGDMGHKPKQLKAYITNCVNSIGALNIGMVCVNHSYESQDMFNPDPKVSGGSGLVYASSIVVVMGKLKLKEDEDGNKTSEVNGIRSKCKVMKTRYNKPFEDVEIKIPWNEGMNPVSGLLDMFEKYGLIVKSGNRLSYVDIDTGEQVLQYRKDWVQNTNSCLDLVMGQFNRHPLISHVTEEEKGDEEFGADIDLPDEEVTGV
jgi:recombination protein RecA